MLFNRAAYCHADGRMKGERRNIEASAPCSRAIAEASADPADASVNLGAEAAGRNGTNGNHPSIRRTAEAH